MVLSKTGYFIQILYSANETVALQVGGHGLGQGHFGKLFRTEANEKFHFSPGAVMNAGYTGVQTTISQSDNGGHCSNWSEWPNN